jgi:hypothetical protein
MAVNGIRTADDLECVRVFADADGISHFAVDKVSFELVEFAPPASQISASNAIPAQAVTIISSPAGWIGDWHPDPRRQMMFMLDGRLQVEVSDGEVRSFGPGDVLLVEDTVGEGHVSRVVGARRLFMAVVALGGNVQ